MHLLWVLFCGWIGRCLNTIVHIMSIILVFEGYQRMTVQGRNWRVCG